MPFLPFPLFCHFTFLSPSLINSGESKNRLEFLSLLEFQSHNTLPLLLLRVIHIHLQSKSNNFHGLTIKTKRILGLKLGQIQVHIIMTYALRSAIESYFITSSRNIVERDFIETNSSRVVDTSI